MFLKEIDLTHTEKDSNLEIGVQSIIQKLEEKGILKLLDEGLDKPLAF